MGEMKIAHKILFGTLKRRDHTEDLGRGIILKWKLGGSEGTEFIWPRIGIGGRLQ